METAKKIQAGEIEGRILTKNGLACEIVAWCGIDFFVKRKAYVYSSIWCYPYTKDGYFIDGKNNGGTDYDLIIELPEEAPKHEFKPFDKVLVRMGSEEVWKVSLYGFKRDDGTHCGLNKSCWKQCIPYEGNEHLVGTTDKPKEV